MIGSSGRAGRHGGRTAGERGHTDASSIGCDFKVWNHTGAVSINLNHSRAITLPPSSRKIFQNPLQDAVASSSTPNEPVHSSAPIINSSTSSMEYHSFYIYIYIYIYMRCMSCATCVCNSGRSFVRIRSVMASVLHRRAVQICAPGRKRRIIFALPPMLFKLTQRYTHQTCDLGFKFRKSVKIARTNGEQVEIAHAVPVKYGAGCPYLNHSTPARATVAIVVLPCGFNFLPKVKP